MLAQGDGRLMEAMLPARRPLSSIDVMELFGVVRRRLALVFGCGLLFLVLAALYIHHQHPVYRSTVEILVDPQGLQVVGRDILPTDSSASIDFANVDSQPLIIASTNVLAEVIRKLDLEHDPFYAGSMVNWPADGEGAVSPRFVHVLDMLRGNVVIHRADPSLVFQITVTHDDADRAALIANTISAVYLEQSREARLTAARQANESLVGQATSLRAQFEEAQHRLEQFRADNGLVTTGTAGLVVNQRLQDLTTRITAATAQVAELEARRNQVRGLDLAVVEAGGIPEVVSSPTITALRTQYGRVVQQQAELARSLGPNHPALQQSDSEREAVARLIDAEIIRIKQSIEADYARAKANLASLQGQEQAITATQATSNTAEIRARELQGDADAIQQVYNAVLNRTKELDLQQQIQTNNSRVISEAVPPVKASAPPKAIVLAAGTLFGLAVGIALAFAVDFLASDPIARLRAISGSLGTELVGLLPSRRRRWLKRDGVGHVEADDPDAADREALFPAAQALAIHLADALPATILLIEAGSVRNGPRVARGLAGALADLGEETLLCSANDISSMLRIERSAPETIRAAHKEVSERLLGTHGRRRAGIQDPDSSDPYGLDGREFILIDGGPSRDTRTLAASYGYVDAVIVVATTGHSSSEDVRDLIASLGPLASAAIGVVGVVDR
ncbi:GumC family protein [Mesorhizobium sp. BR1-1-16]|uniref:GumC family protein n=1 Tax=Mesorhizobium sp. BR1-1-16 TaxID=2876653 RepID=UPI001CCA0437|nr:GumC family protein [Mesorhizobium sp. BR1-1-16]MBZ9936169.1 GumC family protein [Mesorhizobium sp. BR1-1-16]